MRLLLLLKGEKVREVSVMKLLGSTVIIIGGIDIAAGVEIAVETGTAMMNATSVVEVESKTETGTARPTMRGITAEADTTAVNETNERNHHATQTR